jgi:hypothetical protein
MSHRGDVSRLVDLQCKKWELSQLKLTGEFGAQAAKSEAAGEKAYADRQATAAKGAAPKN